MKRLKVLILLFLLTVSLPLAYVAWQSYQSLSQEEKAQLRFFSEAMFDEMEKERIREEALESSDPTPTAMTEMPCTAKFENEDFYGLNHRGRK